MPYPMWCQLYSKWIRQLIWYEYLDLSWSGVCKVRIQWWKKWSPELIIPVAPAWINKHWTDPSSAKACVPQITLHGCWSSLQQHFWAFARDPFFLIVQNAARYRFCNSIDVQIRLWLSYCDNTRGFQTFTINRQGLECQTAINRIQHSYNPNFSELEPSKVRLTYIHLIM